MRDEPPVSSEETDIMYCHAELMSHVSDEVTSIGVADHPSVNSFLHTEVEDHVSTDSTSMVDNAV